MVKSNVQYTSNLSEAKSRLNNAQRAAVIAACLTVERYAKQYSRVGRKGGGGTRDSYTHEVQGGGEAELIGAIGSDMMNAVYEEYGTGEFAEKGDGRKGGWVYYDPVAGEFYFTYGKKPNKPLRRAGAVSRAEVQKIVGDHYKEAF